MEDETGVDTNALNGRSVVTIDSFVYKDGDDNVSPDYVWQDGVGSKAGFIVNTTLGSPADFTSYASQNYSSGNTSLALYADESILPEPLTLTLLGLGGLFCLRKRRA